MLLPWVRGPLRDKVVNSEQVAAYEQLQSRQRLFEGRVPVQQSGWPDGVPDVPPAERGCARLACACRACVLRWPVLPSSTFVCVLRACVLRLRVLPSSTVILIWWDEPHESISPYIRVSKIVCFVPALCY